MEVRQIANSAAALRFAHWLGRHLPLRAGYAFADGLTGVLARRSQSMLLRTLHSNLSVVLGTTPDDERVHALARQTLRHAGRVYIDLYHALGVGPEAFVASVKGGSLLDSYLERMQHERRGVVVVTAHMSNFDLAGLAFAYRGVRMTALGFAEPTSGYNLQNQMRLDGGSIDRPDPFGGGEMVSFFGRSARLPIGHVRLAMQTGSPIVVASCEYRERDHSYIVHVSRWLEIERVGTRQEDILHNARRVLEVAEGLIAAHPDQWMMFYPVWEEAP